MGTEGGENPPHDRLQTLLCTRFKILDGIMIIFCVPELLNIQITGFCQTKWVKAYERMFFKLLKLPAVLKMMKVD